MTLVQLSIFIKIALTVIFTIGYGAFFIAQMATKIPTQKNTFRYYSLFFLGMTILLAF